MSIWQAMSKKQYDVVINLVKKTPELVNDKDEEANSLFMVALQKKNVELLNFILAHELFDPHYTNELGETNIDCALSAADADIFKIAIQNPRFLVNGENLNAKNLTYQCAQAKLRAAKRVYDKEPDLLSQVRVENFQIIVAILRDATIRHAIATDNKDLFDQLEKAGADPSAALMDKSSPQDLLTDKNPNLKSWFSNNFEKIIAKSTINPNTHFAKPLNEMRILQNKMAALKMQEMEAESKVLESGCNARSEILGKTLTINM